ncbi:NmrA/HSCARG family protein [Aspergillus stella-maris]|uniref:NmrA/HSCARG family protein n=1 Tax=Aspergillus stella-maris TaxID=1810926 RepID=UPI003CCE4C5E
MSKLITIIGATGIQGGSVVKALQNDPTWSIRAITRNTSTEAAKTLSSQGIEVVKADLNDIDSLTAAFKGTTAIFAVTNFFETLGALTIEKSMEVETTLGINLAIAASKTESLEHYIFSTLPDSSKYSGGKAIVPYYESKNAVERYIRSNLPGLLEKTTFLWLGWYASNVLAPPCHPSKIHSVDGTDTYVTLWSVPSTTKIPLLGDERVNPGLFVRSVLARPDKTQKGIYVRGITRHGSIGEVIAAFAEAKGIKIHYLQVPKEEYTPLWPGWGTLMDLSHSWLELTGGWPEAGTEGVVTAEELGVKGLISTKEAFKGFPLL